MPISTTGTETRLSDCIRECTACHETCQRMVDHCLSLGGRHLEGSHVRLLIDCAEICQTSANFLLRDSDLHAEACRACAVVCHRCAEQCEAIAAGDAQLEQCAEACRRCASACEQMAA